MRKSHPLTWRRQVMDDCDCCDDLKNQQCTVCGWHEATENGPELHERHMTHVLAEEQERERAERDDEG